MSVEHQKKVAYRRYPRPGLWYPRFPLDVRVRPDPEQPGIIHYKTLPIDVPVEVIETKSYSRTREDSTVEFVDVTVINNLKLETILWTLDFSWQFSHHSDHVGHWGQFWKQVE